MSYSRSNSQDGAAQDGAVRASLATYSTPWPSLDTAMSYEAAHVTDPSDYTTGTEYATAQQSLESVVHRTEARPEVVKQRRPSRLRLFTNGFPRLRRMGTERTSASTGDTSDTTSPVTTTSLTALGDANGTHGVMETCGEAGETCTGKDARNCKQLASLMERMAKRLPSPVDHDHDQSFTNIVAETTALPTTLRAAVRIFPNTKILSKDYEECSIAVEVEGVLRNRQPLLDTTVDIIFVLDNGYYVSEDCLKKALDAVTGALYHLRRGDRLALYTTHCAHHEVSGNKPELHHPLQPFSRDCEEVFQELTGSIFRYGTQAWTPARPNPSMTEVVLCVARSLKDHDLKSDRTHIILLSPAAYVLHDVSKTFSNLRIHRINPAILPYRRDPELHDTVCFENCCQNVFVSNWSSYQSVPGRIKRILKYARAKTPAGELTNLAIDIRVKDGCELVECIGSKDLPCLRLGQVHSFVARIRVNRAETQSIDLESVNPVLNSSLDAKGLRQELQNAAAVGAVKVHLFDVQLYYQDSINSVDCWNYTESPLFTIRDLGGLSTPVDTAIELYKRQYFHKFNQLPMDPAKLEADSLLATLNAEHDLARKVVEPIVKEIKYHQDVSKYELESRQKLPLCAGPIELEGTHEWLLEQWNKRKEKRRGMTGVYDENFVGRFEGMDGLGRRG